MRSARQVERQVGAEKFGWSARRPPNADGGPVKRGMGMAQSQWVSVIHPPTACEVRITDDGSVEAFSSAQDVGTGTRTVLAQVVAEEFGLRADEVGALHRRHAVSDRPAVGRQPRHRIADAGGAQRRLPRRARPGRPAGARARGQRRRHRVRGRPCRGARQRRRRGCPSRMAVKKAGVTEISHRAVRQDDYEGYMMSTAAVRRRPARHRRRAVRGGRRRYRDRQRQGASASWRCTTAAGRSIRS